MSALTFDKGKPDKARITSAGAARLVAQAHTKIKSTEETSGQSKRGEDDGDNCKPLHDDVHLVALGRVSEVV